MVDFQVLQLPILGVSPAIVQVCLTEPRPDLINVDVVSSNELIAFLNVNQISLGTILFNCQILLFTGFLDGTATIQATYNNVTIESPLITFGAGNATATDTPAPPTATNTPPVETATNTPVPPTATATATPPTVSFEVIAYPILGITPAVVHVCWDDPIGSLILLADVISTNSAAVTLDLDLQFTSVVPCHNVVMVGLLSGDTQLQVTVDGNTCYSEVIHFGL